MRVELLGTVPSPVYPYAIEAKMVTLEDGEGGTLPSPCVILTGVASDLPHQERPCIVVQSAETARILAAILKASADILERTKPGAKP